MPMLREFQNLVQQWQQQAREQLDAEKQKKAEAASFEQWRDYFIEQGQPWHKASQLAWALQAEGKKVNESLKEGKRTEFNLPNHHYYRYFKGQTRDESNQSAQLIKNALSQYQEDVVRNQKPLQHFGDKPQRDRASPPSSTDEYFKSLHQRLSSDLEDLRNHLYDNTFHFTKERVAPLDPAIVTSHTNLHDLAKSKEAQDTYANILKELDTISKEKAVPSEILTRMSTLSTESPLDSNVYKTYMESPYFKNMLTDYDAAARRKFNEEVLPKVQNQYLGRGLTPSTARTQAQTHAAQKYYTVLDENMRKMLNEQHEAGVRAASEAQKFGLTAAQTEVGAREQARNMALSAKNAQAAALHNKTQDVINRSQMAHNAGVIAQQHAQNKIQADLDRFQEERDAPLQLTRIEAATAHNVPQITPLPYTSRAPIPVASPSPWTVGSSTLATMLGMDKEKKAVGGEVGNEDYTPTQREQLEISRQLAQPSGDPMKRLFALIGANQMANLRKDPLESMGAALLSHQINEAEREKQFNDRQLKRAELLDAIDKQKLKQRELVDHMIRHKEDLAHKKDELGETRTYHNRSLDVQEKLKQLELGNQMKRHLEDLAHKKDELGETRTYHNRSLDVQEKLKQLELGNQMTRHRENLGHKKDELGQTTAYKNRSLDLEEKLKQLELGNQMTRHRENLGHKKDELGETRTYHNRYLDIHEKKQNQPKSLSSKDLLEARGKAEADIESVKLIREAKKQLETVPTGEGYVSLLKDVPVLGSVLRNPVVRSGFSESERSQRANLNQINKNLGSSIAKALGGNHTSAALVNWVEQAVPSENAPNEANIQGYDRLERSALGRLETAYKLGVISPDEWKELQQVIGSSSSSEPSSDQRRARLAELRAKKVA